MKKYYSGLDIGSTTSKMIVLDEEKQVVHHGYTRHHTKIHQSIKKLLDEFHADGQNQSGEMEISITGSIGLGLAEKMEIPFIQEVIATSNCIRNQHPEVNALLDIGGEDSKLIFFENGKPPDMKMNGNCAGGTGAFIDQIAEILGISVTELDKLAQSYTKIYPIASRCGVFAKTDIQSLIARHVPINDIAASVFHAMAIQAINTLARGKKVSGNVLFSGGPFTFLPSLKNAFVQALHLDKSNIILTSFPHMIPAFGASLNAFKEGYPLAKFTEKLDKYRQTAISVTTCLQPLFTTEMSQKEWNSVRNIFKLPETNLDHYKGKKCYLGIDSGSTTTKIVITGEEKQLLFQFYANNHDKPLEAILTGLKEFKKLADKNNLTIAGSCVTGYGEDLVRCALNLDHGMVETMAHFMAAHKVNKDMSFIIDIGGQDIKASFIKNGIIFRTEINESCSSGCGSFIESFGNTMGYSKNEFSKLACQSTAPCDLGSRCTVFINSKVKQAMRDHAGIEDISAGLAYSVIQNALYKVLKINDIDQLGKNIMVQGGTFRNPAVVRAMEILTGKNIYSSNYPEIMGAYGAALYAMENEPAVSKSSFIGLDKISGINPTSTKKITCKGCENMCLVSVFHFDDRPFFSGNKCEKVFASEGEKNTKGTDLTEFKYNLLFDRASAVVPESKKKMTIGIPRVLNMFENFPFWHKLLTECGIQVVLSDKTTNKTYEDGTGHIMSDNICFPAKLVHGHINNLAEKGIDRLLYPIAVYDNTDFDNTANTFNCPIVCGYPDVISSSHPAIADKGIGFDTPVVTFKDENYLKKSCYKYLSSLGIKKVSFEKAFEKAWKEKHTFKKQLKQKALSLISKAEESNNVLVVLAGRPYHSDPFINHRITQIISDLGVDVITEDALIELENPALDTVQVISQWTYTNRLYNAAHWVGMQGQNIQLVQINSFGCGPDAIAADEIKEILNAYGKTSTFVRVDDIASTGAMRLRIRSMVESVNKQQKKNEKQLTATPRVNTKAFETEDTGRSIVAPWFSDFFSPFIVYLMELAGFRVESLPPPDRKSIELGLKYANNEICYPAKIIVGDVIKGLQSGNYDFENITIGITQTGGPCRASSYLSLIKKAMIAAGYKDIPVISVSTGSGNLNSQPGFEFDWKKLVRPAFVACLYADALSRMYYSSSVREVKKGASRELMLKYQELSKEKIIKKDIGGLFKLLKQAIREFNALDVHDKKYTRVGVVGEIYVKYNDFGCYEIPRWLSDNGYEVVVPPLLDFFIQDFVNYKVNKKENLTSASASVNVIVYFLEHYAKFLVSRFDKIFKQYRYYIPYSPIYHVSNYASRILNLANQYGEGWLIPGEIADFQEMGINNVLCLQPFGCIANQVVAKGVESKMKNIYPDANILYLDIDDGVGEVHLLNRLHLFVDSAVSAG